MMEPGVAGQAQQLMGRLDAAASTEALEKVLREIRGLVAMRARNNDDALETGRLASGLYDRLLARAAWMARAGPDAPGGGYCLVVLGSQGRREQFLATDQDNALILGDGAQEGAFAAFAGRLAEILEAAGMPPCPKGIMAANPFWRRSFDSWSEAVDAAVDRPDAPDVLLVSLLADARPVAGDSVLAATLADHLRRRLAEAPLATRLLAREALGFGPPAHLPGHLPLGRFGLGHTTMDLKRQAVYPLVLGIKALALDAGLAETETVARIAGLAGLGHFGDDLAGRLRQAFGHIQSLRLGVQASAHAGGRTPDNGLDLTDLHDGDKERLREDLAALDRLAAILEHHFSLHALT
ncbi:protein of unknown function DUF294 nucleotidyltransferase putative [Solidesulfovibrio fructosivorans JJ]]|uniref:Signal transduction protein n=1 Tax=Solidesulfovibrio fructosivorans JJ] TaxID=596151 RepID=E1JUV6_SOLFR|nr:DUF294 nucleotidyltransferase-like domain-containing protein [Solidesulfovibrio fructosivorans]EFL51870.1 protein of unknown function DUF294 nucleotidyltransferase putative [Solidesulfovibrio fructosivorans JJ]]